MLVSSWVMHSPGAPFVFEERDVEPVAGEVVVAVAGCGVCHTDLGFFYDRVPTRHALPLTLGHEVSGVVVATGPGTEEWEGTQVIVPAVIPCGRCPTCEHGRGQICPNQIFPGNDVHGGFGTHVRVPAHGLCPVPDLGDPAVNPQGLALADLSVIADAVSTPYQAVVRSGLLKGELAVFVGVGGVGGFGVQIASSLGAHVIALDLDRSKLDRVASYGADLCLCVEDLDAKELRRAVRAFANDRGVPTWSWRIFETSGTASGQRTAFGLMARGSYLSLVGYTAEKVEVHLSRLMALDATVEGNWGCLPHLYAPALDLVLEGSIALEPFIETRPLETINETFRAVRDHEVSRRVILTPV